MASHAAGPGRSRMAAAVPRNRKLHDAMHLSAISPVPVLTAAPQDLALIYELFMGLCCNHAWASFTACAETDCWLVYCSLCCDKASLSCPMPSWLSSIIPSRPSQRSCLLDSQMSKFVSTLVCAQCSKEIWPQSHCLQDDMQGNTGAVSRPVTAASG